MNDKIVNEDVNKTTLLKSHGIEILEWLRTFKSLEKNEGEWKLGTRILDEQLYQGFVDDREQWLEKKNDVIETNNNKLKEAEYLKYGSYRECEKNTPYEDKVKMFEINLGSMFYSPTLFIGHITKENLTDIYELLKNENVLVPQLPVFKYNGKVMSLSDGGRNTYEFGKYENLTASEISDYLNENYIVFIYTILNVKHGKGEELKYRTVVLLE
jgi:hypothetical protein